MPTGTTTANVLIDVFIVKAIQGQGQPKFQSW